MAKITRKTAQLFGSTAGTDQIAQFGSLEENSPVYSTDPAVIQQLSNWLQGWFAAVDNEFSPAIEDMNGVCYVLAYQIAYLMQQGIAEWDSATTYYIGSLVNSSGNIYASLTDTNLNNAVTNGSFWKVNSIPTTGITNAMVAAAAGIVYSKLNLTGSIVNADISNAAAIAYSKLSLAASIATADLASGLLVPSTKGGTGVSNAGSLTYGANNIAITTSGVTAITVPASGTLMPGTNWVSYTPTFAGLGTVSGISVFWKRVGDAMRVRGRVTPGTTTGAAVTISLPSGNTIDTAKCSGSQSNTFGILGRAVNAASNALPGTAAGPYVVTENLTTSTSVVYVSNSTNTSSGPYIGVVGTGLAGTGDVLMFEFEVPITQFAF